MLKPAKHTNVKYSVIYMSGIILKYLQEENILKYDDLKETIINQLGLAAKYKINCTLTFLYSIGKIQYLKEIDAITLSCEERNENF